jgi:hypothetical protein
MSTKSFILSEEEIELITLFRNRKNEKREPEKKRLQAILKESLYSLDQDYPHSLEVDTIDISIEEVSKLKVKLEKLMNKAFYVTHKKGKKFVLNNEYWEDSDGCVLCEDSPYFRKRFFEKISE